MKLVLSDKAVSWIATVINLAGILLISYKNIWCWPVYIIANCIWFIYFVRKKDSALMFLNCCYLVFNLFGWYSWAAEK